MENKIEKVRDGCAARTTPEKLVTLMLMAALSFAITSAVDGIILRMLGALFVGRYVGKAFSWFFFPAYDHTAFWRHRCTEIREERDGWKDRAVKAESLVAVLANRASAELKKPVIAYRPLGLGDTLRHGDEWRSRRATLEGFWAAVVFGREAIQLTDGLLGDLEFRRPVSEDAP